MDRKYINNNLLANLKAQRVDSGSIIRVTCWAKISDPLPSSKLFLVEVDKETDKVSFIELVSENEGKKL